MTAVGAPRPRQWISAMRRDPAILAAVRAAAAECMRDACERHRPADCGCPEQRISPQEFVAWIEDTLRITESPPVRFEPGGRPGRRPLATIEGIRAP